MSAILSVDDLNDFITPGVACIKPVETLPQKPSHSSENPYEVTTEDKVQYETSQPTQISLTDCLACSGCVTSAEAVLISLQSHAEVLNTLNAHPEIRLTSDLCGGIVVEDGQAAEGRIFVASISPQVQASLAAAFGLSKREVNLMIDQFLRGPQGLRSGGRYGNGFAWVVDTSAMREAVLTFTSDEVDESFSPAGTSVGENTFNTPKRPILSSACPGWICYAEKTHSFILPHLSRLKSPQALTGTFLKTVLSKALGVSPSQIWHLAIMPCFDKKLEASREELTDSSWRLGDVRFSEAHARVRDVDCVITTRELLMLASSRAISLPSLPFTPLPSNFTPRFPDQLLDSFLFSSHPSFEQTPETGTSGGYLSRVLVSLQSRNSGSQILTQRGRNADVVEYTLVSSEGHPIVKAARYYGFRNIQNLVRKLKPARISRLPGAKAASDCTTERRQVSSKVTAYSGGSGSDYAYVEVMACPGGCTNGGGQIRLEEAREIKTDPLAVPSGTSGTKTKPSPGEQRAWLARVDEAYCSAKSDSVIEFESQLHLLVSEKDAHIRQTMQYWSELTGIPLPKLIYTTYRRVESDVGKKKDGSSDTSRVVELAGKIGGGW